MRAHAQLSEDSVSRSLNTPIGKGREGKGIGSGGEVSFQDLHLQRHLGDAPTLTTAGAVK